MKLTVLGATGGTGLRFVEQATAAGHEVTAVVRDPARLTYDHPNLTAVVSDVLNPDSLASVVDGREAVVSALGSSNVRTPTTLQTDSTRALARAMADTGVRRLVVVSNAGMDGSEDDVLTKFVVKPIIGRVLRHPWGDMARMEEVVRSTDLDWTVVRPPRLTDKPLTGAYRVAANRGLRGARYISRADVADFMLRTLVDPDAIRMAYTIAN